MKKNVSERLERAADQFDCQSARQNSWVTFFSLFLSLFIVVIMSCLLGSSKRAPKMAIVSFGCDEMVRLTIAVA